MSVLAWTALLQHTPAWRGVDKEKPQLATCPVGCWRGWLDRDTSAALCRPGELSWKPFLDHDEHIPFISLDEMLKVEYKSGLIGNWQLRCIFFSHLALKNITNSIYWPALCLWLLPPQNVQLRRQRPVACLAKGREGQQWPVCWVSGAAEV